MKVLFIGNYDIPVHNIRPEAEMIIGLRQRGVDVEVMTRADCWYARRMESCGIRIHDYVPPAKFSWGAVRHIRRVLRDGRHDVVHLFNNKAIVGGVLASFGLPVKVVTYRGQTGNISRLDPVAYLTHLSPRVDAIVCVANAVRDDLRARVWNPAKVVTIYKGHDLAWYAGTRPADLASLGVPAGAFVVTCVANNRPRKGVPVLVDSTAHVPPDAGIHWLLIGRGMRDPDILARIDRSPVRERIHVFDHRDDVLEIVAASNATVLPATKREGLPKTVIESMALGVTAVVTRTGGSPELVIDGETGLVVPPGDAPAIGAAITRLYRDPAENARMGALGRERLARHFRLEDSVEGHLRLYRELLAPR
jgi:glycosyltransferase involved in cell wall biosynthesis